MNIISNTLDFQISVPTALTIGKFDGVHLGHQRLLQEILAKKQEGLAACVLTFDPPPSVLFAGADGKMLTTLKEKRELFQRMGVDFLIEFPLTTESAAISPRIFVREYLVNQLQAKFVAAGEDLSFGAGGLGNAELLREMSAFCGFETKIIEKVRLEDRIISSTLVRERLEEGDMPGVHRLLGMPYSILGTVEHGRQLGRKLGMPTVNLYPESGKLLPPCGVYFSKVRFLEEEALERTYFAISNVGYKPTVSMERRMGVESYLYDFQKEIYGREIEVGLYEFRRPERRFADVEALKAQVEEDIQAGMRWKEGQE